MEQPWHVETKTPDFYSIKDRLPEEGQAVMTCGRVRWAVGGDIPKWFANWFTGGEFANYPECVQYWFPLPEIPADVFNKN